MSYNNAVITEEDFKRERAKRDREILNRISSSKSLNKKWIAHLNGYDVDYIANPAQGQTE